MPNATPATRLAHWFWAFSLCDKIHLFSDWDSHKTCCTGTPVHRQEATLTWLSAFSVKRKHSVTGRQNKKQRLEQQRLSARAILPYLKERTASSRTSSPSTVNPQNLANRRSNQRSHAGTSRAAIRTQCPSRRIKAGSIALLSIAWRKPTPAALMDTPAQGFLIAFSTARHAPSIYSQELSSHTCFSHPRLRNGKDWEFCGLVKFQ